MPTINVDFADLTELVGQKLSKEEAEELGYEPSKDYIRTTEKLAESQKK